MLEYSGSIIACCGFELQDSTDPPTSASQIARTTAARSATCCDDQERHLNFYLDDSLPTWNTSYKGIPYQHASTSFGSSRYSCSTTAHIKSPWST